MALLYENKIRDNKTEFIAKLLEISEQLDFNPNWLMAVFNKESGVNAKARNTTYLVSGFPATGLIQWVEPTAQSLYGISVNDIYEMNNVEQLDLVLKYFNPVAHKITKYSDVYRYIFFPASLSKPDDYVFQTSNLSASKVASQNPVIDLNKDGKITNKEFGEYAIKDIPEPYKTEFINNTRDTVYKSIKRNKIEIIIGVFGLFVSGLIVYKYILKK